MDANGNGTLEPGEVPEERKRMFSFIAGRVGLDPEKPVEIGKIRETMMSRSGGGDGSRDESRSKEDDSEKKKKAEEEPLVPGFGVSQEWPRVPGFGERVELASATSPSNSSDGTAGRSGSSQEGRSSGDDRSRRFAEYMLRRYDSNNSGSLEKEEWGRLQERGRDPRSYDRNKDGVITVDEMAARIAEYGMGRGRGPGEDSSTADRSDSSESDERGSYRFLSATERLSGDVPDWFLDRDANGDGQVAMAEYTSFWTDSKAREFARYDHNNDGVITPQESVTAPVTMDVAAADSGEAEVTSEKADADKDKGSSTAWWMSP
jgi:Ca2+-binding EF-hand superfamily protein